MNNSTALDILKHSQSGDISDIKEAMKCAFIAIEKQIPKKIGIKVNSNRTLWGENFVGKYGYCSCCKQHLILIINSKVVAGEKTTIVRNAVKH